MNFVFRTDASSTIGHGHVQRCLTLASALEARGAVVTFISRQQAGDLCELIEERGFAVHRLPPADGHSPYDETVAHAAWLGAPWREDVERTREIVKNLASPADWLIADHYALDRRWERAVRGVVPRIMVIDDLADRPHDCDLLLDQNLVASWQTRYEERVPEACGLLLGPEYALLQPIYAELQTRVTPRVGPVRRVLIAFGGADGTNMTGLALTALLCLGRADILVDVVVSGGSPHAAAIREQAAAYPNVRVHADLATLAPLISEADLAVGAAGATSWERLCLGLPTLLVTLAQNQVPVAAELSRRNLVRWLGHLNEVSESDFSEALNGLIQSGLDDSWSVRCLAAIDGKGCERVCAALTSGVVQ